MIMTGVVRGDRGTLSARSSVPSPACGVAGVHAVLLLRAGACTHVQQLLRIVISLPLTRHQPRPGIHIAKNGENMEMVVMTASNSCRL